VNLYAHFHVIQSERKKAMQIAFEC